MSKYNVSDMKGNPIPDEAIEDWAKWVHEHLPDMLSDVARGCIIPDVRPNVMVAGTPDKVDEESKSPKSDAVRAALEKAGLKTVDWQLDLPEVQDIHDRGVVFPGADPHARMIDLICDLAIVGNPDVQPPEVLGDFSQRARDILNVFEAEEVTKKWSGEATEPTTTWDYADEDGDVHSPAWYIEAFMVSNMEYMRLHQIQTDAMTPEQEANHMAALDDALLEAEMYERYVNQLFGYSDE